MLLHEKSCQHNHTAYNNASNIITDSINNKLSQHVVAKFAFESRYENEISMKGGDKIEIVEKDLDVPGYTRVRNLSRGDGLKKGYVPTKYLELNII